MRIVIKIGTNLITAANGLLDVGRISELARDIVALRREGQQVILVTSGAIGAGMGRMGLKTRPQDLREKQALAAVGQPLLMNVYQDAFEKLNVPVAQVLLTRQDFYDRQRYLNARNTLLTLLEMGALPVINENDTVAVDEIKVGDNDTLAALVAAKVSAELLVLLTDVDGLYKGVPGKSELVRVVEKVTSEIEAYAGGQSSSGKGVGGMQTKLGAAKIATVAGVRMIIANGRRKNILRAALDGTHGGTEFAARHMLDARRCWIAFGSKCRGTIVVDRGAATALHTRGGSLLPSGVTATEGAFAVGDTVSIIDAGRREIARGLTYYSSADIEKIKGKKSSHVKKIIPAAGYEEIIHRDNLVLL